MRSITARETIKLNLWATVAAVAVVAVGIVINVTRAPPLEVLESDITKSVEKGGFISVRRTVNWLRTDCPRIASQAEFIDSLYPPRVHPVPLQRFGTLHQHKYFDTQWQVTFDQPWGETKFTNKLSLACFPFYELWPIEVEMPPLRFHVSPP